MSAGQGQLVAIVGNSGVGKTTFARQLRRLAPFVTGLEQHAERPFQQLFSLDLSRYALANQIDYLLLRAEQELVIRNGHAPGLVDGGLDQDFHVFTRHFYLRGYLAENEYQLCARAYRFFRQVLPPPDLIVRLVASLEVIAERYARRNRTIEIARLNDLRQLEDLIEEWLPGMTAARVITVDAGADDPAFSLATGEVLAQIQQALGVSLPAPL